MQREEIDYMSYNHRIATREQETALTVPQTSDAGLRVIVGTAPINLAADPSAAVNKPVLVNSFAEGVEALGYSSDFRSYTISELMDYTFRVKNVGPIICINVLDPAKHKKDLAESLTVTSNKATISEEGVMLSDLVVKNGETILEKGADYVAAFNDAGGVDITLLKDGVSEISVSGTQLDPSQVTKEDIIGGYNASTGEEKELKLSARYIRNSVWFREFFLHRSGLPMLQFVQHSRQSAKSLTDFSLANVLLISTRPKQRSTQT